MQCKEVAVVLEQEGWTPLPEAAREHVAGCGNCQSLVEDLTEIVATAHLLPAEVEPPARVWVALKAQLEQEGIIVDTRPPQGIPDKLADLQNYELLMISNVPATSMSKRQMQVIRTYVEELGGGLFDRRRKAPYELEGGNHHHRGEHERRGGFQRRHAAEHTHRLERARAKLRARRATRPISRTFARARAERGHRFPRRWHPRALRNRSPARSASACSSSWRTSPSASSASSSCSSVTARC